MLTVEKKIISDCLSGLGISGVVCLWGRRVTRRKRQEKQDNNSLASALGEFLSQWQKQHPPARKTQKTSSTASSQDWYKGSSDDYDYGYWNYEAPQTHSDENLVQTLLTFLNTCQQTKNQRRRGG